MIDKLKSFLSKKLIGTILATIVTMWGLPVTPELQAEILKVLWAVYLIAQGTGDAAARLMSGK